MMFKIMGKDGKCYGRFINNYFADKWLNNHKQLFPKRCEKLQLEIVETEGDE